MFHAAMRIKTHLFKALHLISLVNEKSPVFIEIKIFLGSQFLPNPVVCGLGATEMFGARVVRQKRERERADRNLNDLDRNNSQPALLGFCFPICSIPPIMDIIHKLTDWVTGLFKGRSFRTSNRLERDLIQVNCPTSNTGKPWQSWSRNVGFILRY